MLSTSVGELLGRVSELDSGSVAIGLDGLEAGVLGTTGVDDGAGSLFISVDELLGCPPSGLDSGGGTTGLEVLGTGAEEAGSLATSTGELLGNGASELVSVGPTMGLEGLEIGVEGAGSLLTPAGELLGSGLSELVSVGVMTGLEGLDTGFEGTGSLLISVEELLGRGLSELDSEDGTCVAETGKGELEAAGIEETLVWSTPDGLAPAGISEEESLKLLVSVE